MWSWRKLVAEFGEDSALVMLEEMKGTGEYEHFVVNAHSRLGPLTHWAYDGRDTPYNDVHEEIPIKFPKTELWDLELEVGVILSAWRETTNRIMRINDLLDENISSILRQT